MSGARQRLTRASRIQRREEFAAAFRQGRRFSDQLFQVRVISNRLPCARLGISVSLRVSTKAVERNRIKRQVREVFRHTKDRLAGLDLVFVAQSAAHAADNAQLRASLHHHLLQIERRCKRS